MNYREVFDKVAVALLKQNKKSRASSHSCVYVGPNGLRCAIGHIAPDEFAAKDYEGLTISDIGPSVCSDMINDCTFVHSEETNAYVDFLELLNKKCGATTSRDFEFLQNLQQIHDSKPVYLWHIAFEELANKYNVFPSPEFWSLYNKRNDRLEAFITGETNA